MDKEEMLCPWDMNPYIEPHIWKRLEQSLKERAESISAKAIGLYYGNRIYDTTEFSQDFDVSSLDMPPKGFREIRDRNEQKATEIVAEQLNTISDLCCSFHPWHHPVSGLVTYSIFEFNGVFLSTPVAESPFDTFAYDFSVTLSGSTAFPLSGDIRSTGYGSSESSFAELTLEESRKLYEKWLSLLERNENENG